MISGRLVVPSQFLYSGKNTPLATLSALQQRMNTGNTLQNRYLLTYGTASGQIDTIIANAYELAASASNTHNFFDGTVPDIFGDANGLQNIKFLGVYLVANTDGSTAATSATIGNAAANPLVMNFGGTTPTYQIFAGGPTFQAGKPAGYTVSNTIKNLKVLNDDGANKLTYFLLAGGVKV